MSATSCVTPDAEVAAPARFCRLLLLILLLLMPGCDGCRDAEEDEAEKDQMPVQAIESQRLRVQPATEGLMLNNYKPGHWGTASLELKSNIDDLRGDLESVATGDAMMPFEVPGTDTAIRFQRPAVLPKGQRRRLQIRFLMPGVPGFEGRKGLKSDFSSRGGGLVFSTGNEPLAAMQPQEYFFVTFTDRSEFFIGLQAADFTALPTDLVTSPDKIWHYRVVIPAADDLISLSDSLFGWTATAYLLWDDTAPLQITDDQQRAIIDWVHFGGRLIVNGPARQDWNDSFLAPYLPLADITQTELDGEAMGQMVTAWSVPDDPSGDVISRTLRERTGVPGIEGQRHPQTQEVADSRGLVLRRRVGRGLVVMTRFDLTEDWLRKWNSMQSFYNGALMARPPRRYRSERIEIAGAEFDDFSDMPASTLTWAGNLEGSEKEAALTTGLRLLTRDGGPGANSVEDAARHALQQGSVADPYDTSLVGSSLGGMGAWNDFSGPAIAAREALREASGISIPRSDFVVHSLAWYLLALVPVNFLLFRLIGRLEWAWLGVPVIAVAGAVWVARNAQLDIGFARSRNELAVLELQPDHPRGVLTRYISLYNSLSTTYRADFDSADVCCAPLAGSRDVDDPTAARELRLRFGYAPGATLDGFAVPSNRTDMLHFEQIFDAGGTLQISSDGSSVFNGTSIDLEDVVVDRSTAESGAEVAVVGLLEAGATAPLQFRPPSEFRGFESSDLSADRLALTCRTSAQLRTGDVRLVGRVPGSLPGVTLTPDASQTAAQSIVIAHLGHADLGPVAPDVTLPARLQAKSNQQGEGEE